MPVTQVTILGINADGNHAIVHWQSDTGAMSAEAYVASTQADLSNPAKRITKQAIVPDIDFQVNIPFVAAGDPPLCPSATYFCQAMCDGVLSAVQSFSTTGGAPLAAQNVQVMIDPINPLTLKFSWTGPFSEQGRVFLGTVSGALQSVGQDLTAGESHSVLVTQVPGGGALQYNQAYYYKVVSTDGSGTVLAASAEQKCLMPKAPNNNMVIQAPPAPTPLVSTTPIPAGSRATITVSVREGNAAANRVLIEFKLADPTMGKLGYVNLPGSDRVQLLSDPNVYESVDFVSNGKVGTTTVQVKVVGGTNPSAVKTATIKVV